MGATARDLLRPVVRVRMQFLPVMLSVDAAVGFCDLLFGPGRLFPAVREGRELTRPLPTDGTLSEYLAETYLRSPEGPRGTLGLSANKVFEWNARLGCRVWPDDGERHLGWGSNFDVKVPVQHWVDHDFYPDVVAAAALAGAVLTEVEYRDPANDIEPIRDLDALGGEAARASLPELDRPTLPPWRGLVGVPWRTLLPANFVDMFGVDRLQALPSELAVEHDNGMWTLQRCESPTDSHSDQALANEQRIIELLGQEFFVNRETLEIPSVVPYFPPEFIPVVRSKANPSA